MSKCVDFNDLQLCIKQGIERKITLKQFLAFTNGWTDFVDGRKWVPMFEAYEQILDAYKLKDKTHYLVQFDDGFIATATWLDGDWDLWADAGEPVAYMPLPEPWKDSRPCAHVTESGWIPYDEAVPIYDGSYLVTDCDRNVFEAQYLGGGFYTMAVEPIDCDVVAWRDDVRPYEPEEG